jgi:cytochrome c oxidase assembly protein subunit 15
VPLVVWSWRGQLTGWIRTRAVLIFLGICAQGVLGWWMVKSGLTERTDVSQYRLMAHLCLAFALLGYIVWTLADLKRERDFARPQDVMLNTVSGRQKALGVLLVPLIFAQIALGALVAGMKAGLLHNTWPLMGDQLIPSGLAVMEPFWRNIFENATMVHFNHRTFGIVVAALTLWHVLRVVMRADDGSLRRNALMLGALVIAQFALGVWTIVAGVPLNLALIHQVLAAILLSASVWHAHGLIRGR